MLRASLLGSVRDLLPQADLRPIRAGAASLPGLRLAALPVELVPGGIDAADGRPASLLRTSLPIAWAAVLFATLAAALVLQKSISLSERRGAFVSAVTHELRTPLTTFRLYTDMLAEGMATTEKDRRDFLDTLRHEAERLDHLVRNVLAYARLERSRTSATLEEIRVSDLLERCRDRLEARGAEAGFTVEVQADSEVGGLRIRTDPSAVEQILFNLVDNAVKYAASATDRRIEVRTRLSGRRLQLSVRDFGPGLSQAARKRLFQPFSKSAVEAARSAPGVGLGLALSRRLARSLGGDLAHDPKVSPGACFVYGVGPTHNKPSQ
jgi:signal transduction histidine kinase